MARSRPGVDDVIAAVGALSPARARPALVVLVGLPGSGKTTLATALRARTGIAVVESDAVRRLLVARPRHTASENRAVFTLVHRTVDALLARGACVAVDATSLRHSDRAPLYAAAERCGARLVVVEVTAAEATIRNRLEARDADSQATWSLAGVEVYGRMRETLGPIRRPHHTVDTGRDTTAAIEAIAREIEAE